MSLYSDSIQQVHSCALHTSVYLNFHCVSPPTTLLANRHPHRCGRAFFLYPDPHSWILEALALRMDCGWCLAHPPLGLGVSLGRCMSWMNDILPFDLLLDEQHPPSRYYSTPDVIVHTCSAWFAPAKWTYSRCSIPVQNELLTHSMVCEILTIPFTWLDANNLLKWCSTY